MLFKPELIEAIKRRQKTQTRRLVREGDKARLVDGTLVWGRQTANDDAVIAVYRNGRLKWEVGRTYAVQPRRGKPAVGRIMIKRIWRERLQDIQCADIIAEGVAIWDAMDSAANVEEFCEAIRQEFAALWNRIHTKRGERWEDNPDVWVLEFELAGDN